MCILLVCVCFKTSVDSVESLVKNHEEFDSTAAAHNDKIQSMCEYAN